VTLSVCGFGCKCTVCGGGGVYIILRKTQKSLNLMQDYVPLLMAC
jgi:hypothetical protein